MLNELAIQIWNHSEFHEDYERLIIESLRLDLRLSSKPVEVDERSLSRLIQSAVHLAGAEDATLRGAAYRIVTACWKMYGEAFPHIADLTQFTLMRLGNFPALKFLFPTKVSRGRTWPRGLWFEAAAHEISNTVVVAPGASVTFTNFQRRLWEALILGQPTAVSAPTSAGKSFALQQFIVSVLVQQRVWCLYLAPTRALLHQVAASLTKYIRAVGVDRAMVTTVPVSPNELDADCGVYVLTQERLQILLRAAPQIHFGMIIVDEAQTIADDSRGIILQDVLESIVHRRGPQLLLASPNTKNPNVFARALELPGVKSIRELESPVAQNVIRVDVDPARPHRLGVSAIFGDKSHFLGRVVLPIELYEEHQKLAVIAWKLGRGEKNIVYSSGPAQCEHVAQLLCDLLEHQESNAEARSETISLRQDLARFIREHIHSKYSLAKAVERGVAFHYGNMPTLLRNAIQQCYESGGIDFVVCTSTLLYGVNLPAKNVFVYNPMKGSDAMPSVDFWNLAGRAGRLGKDIYGNVFLIDIAEWQAKPLEGEREQVVVPALEDTIKNKAGALIEFVSNQAHASGESQREENTFVKLYVAAREGKLDTTVDKILGEDGGSIRHQLVQMLQNAVNVVSLPTEIVSQHASVSVYRQQEMYDVLIAEISSGNVEKLLPLHPLQSGRRPYTALCEVFRKIHVHFEKRALEYKGNTYYATLALKWMRGEPVSRLIDTAYSRKVKTAKTGKSPSVATVIRKVFSEIEHDLRFRYVKYTRCYLDLLALALVASGLSDYVQRIPPIPLFLELGASSATMVSFISMGLSRTTAELLSRYCVDKGMDHARTIEWLRRQDLSAMDLPRVSLNEVAILIAN